MTREERDQAVLARITQSPCTMDDLVRYVGCRHTLINSSIQRLFGKQAIVHRRMGNGRFRYYLRDEAPAPEEKAPKNPMTYRVPVRRVLVRPFSLAGEDGKTAFVTVVAEPWGDAA